MNFPGVWATGVGFKIMNVIGAGVKKNYNKNKHNLIICFVEDLFILLIKKDIFN